MVIASILHGLPGQVSGCDLHRRWLVAFKDGKLHLQWLWKPCLQRFLSRIATLYPDLMCAVKEERRIDLVHFASRAESEQRDLLAQVKRLGYGAACVLILKRYKHLSMAQATEYMAEVDRCG